MLAKLNIKQAGPSVSVQDAGRPGHLRYGVTRSGAMDRAAFTIANAALNNPTSNPAIEISLGGITLECTEGSVSLAIVGGSFTSQLNEKTLPIWSAFTIHTGDTLKIKPGVWGSWCYLAVAGLIESPSWLDSYSVHLNSGLCGRPILQHDVISIQNATTNTNELISLGEPGPWPVQNEIRVVVGPQERYFEVVTLENFFNHEYSVSAEYDRMGMRLSGCTLPIAAALDMPSEPISRGSLQVPGHGDPICLMADHHTAGGYPKIATVISADQDTLAQHRTGDSIRFASVSTAQAIRIARNRAVQLERALERMELCKVSVTQRLWSNNLISGATRGEE